MNIVDSDSYTALTLASKLGHHHSVELLIESGADVNHRVLGRNTALMLASCYGSIESMEILIKAGADVNAINTCGCKGRERLIRSHSSARFCFELSGNWN